jgi:hypothetical protein
MLDSSLAWFVDRLSGLFLLATLFAALVAWVGWSDLSLFRDFAAKGVETTARIEGLQRISRRRSTRYELTLSWYDTNGNRRVAHRVEVRYAFVQRITRGDTITASEPPSLACPTPQGRAAAAEKGWPIPLVSRSERAASSLSRSVAAHAHAPGGAPSRATWSAAGGVTRMCRDAGWRLGRAATFRPRDSTRSRPSSGREPPIPDACRSATAL